MLNILHEVLDILPYLLEDKEGWSSTNVTYAKPHVERIWRQHGEYRILLHRIHPCSVEEALYHPHPWPSAVKIINGKYEMGISDIHQVHFDEIIRGNQYAKIILHSGCEYEMIDRFGQHYVRPIGTYSDSVMITGKPYKDKIKDKGSMPSEKQKPLIPSRFDDLFGQWQGHFKNGPLWNNFYGVTH